MKKYLPIFFFSLIFLSFFFLKTQVFAQSPTPVPTEGNWLHDSEVTFVGKLAARSKEFLNLNLEEFRWVPSGIDNPLIAFWSTIRNIIYALLVLMVLITAFILIINRNKTISITRFIPRFVMVILLVTFSFSLVQFLYQITDILQGFFLKNPSGNIISSRDLLNISFNYQDFIGYRRFGANFDESAFISLLLTKLTALTYFIMTGVLLIRKIILWFFIAVSPLFPLLILYPPIRNTAKIWVGEFFRWLLYAPLFAIFLSQLVSLWHLLIPLPFNFASAGNPDKIVYPTAINILLGGPGQTVTITNSVNTVDTFVLYVVALLMLWVVILLPFVLLQIFLDYFNTFMTGDNWVVKQIVNSGFPFFNKTVVAPSPSPTPSPGSPTGLAKPLPFLSRGKGLEMPIPEAKEAGLAREIPIQQTVLRQAERPLQYRQPIQTQKTVDTEILHMTNLSIPTMRDIARYETSTISRDFRVHEEIAKTHEVLERISNPQIISSTVERERFNLIKEQLTREKEIGNPLATSILTAANTFTSTTESSRQETVQLSEVLKQIAKPEIIAVPEQREHYELLRDQLITERQKGNPLASSILSAVNIVSQKGTDLTTTEQIKDQLVTEKEKGNPVASSVLSTATQITTTKEISIAIREVIEKMARPEIITVPQEKEHFTQLKEELIREQQKGNPVATIVMSTVNDVQQKGAVDTTTIERVKEQLTKEQQKGNPLASSILEIINQTTIEKESSTTVREIFEKLANPEIITVPKEREQIAQLKETLVREEQRGNSLATTILSTVNNLQQKTTDLKTVEEIKEQLIREKEKGNPLASAVLDNVKKVQVAAKIAPSPALPTVNRIQAVSLDDYEAIKKMWQENYQKLEPPKGIDGKPRERKDWIRGDMNKINQTINLLSSNDPQKTKQGMTMVGNILPFLLIGGFSQTEIIAYLKAKLEAGKSTMEGVEKQEEEEETKLEVQIKQEEKPKTMQAEASINPEEKNINNNQPVQNQNIQNENRTYE